MSTDSNSSKKKQSSPGCYLNAALGALFFVLLVKLLFPSAVPFSLFQFWGLNASIGQILVLSWPLFAWGIGITTLLHITQKPKEELFPEKPELILVIGFIESLVAGIFEELTFRWILFYSAIVVYQISDFILLGFLNIHLVQGISQNITVPFANLVTLGRLSPLLYSEYGWFVGAAIISTNGKFRDGHKYLGCLGWVNAWFVGMFMFSLMFNYGLFAAMIVHFTYDMLIFFVVYLFAAKRRAQSY